MLRDTRQRGGRISSLKLSVIVLAVLCFLSIPSTEEVEGAGNDMFLGGEIYLSDGVTPLASTPWANNTSFAIWVNHGGDWTAAIRYPSYPSWNTTSMGWYSYVLPWEEKDINWGDGDEYRVEVDASSILGIQNFVENATSHGTGDPGEFSYYGNLSNNIVWSFPDNWQRWDVIVPSVDLIPYNIAIDGIEFPPPYDPFVPVGPVNVLAGTSHTISANVSNRGTPLIRIPNTIAFYDISSGRIIGSEVIEEIGSWSTAPPNYRINATWTAPPPPFAGDRFIDITVDLYGNVTETNERNNTIRIWFRIKGVDLTPSNIEITTQSGTYSYPNAHLSGYASLPIEVAPGEAISIMTNVSNVGTFDMPAGLKTQLSVYYAGRSPKDFVSPIQEWNDVPDIPADQSVGPFSYVGWEAPQSLGDHYVLIKVDNSSLIQEDNENNNTFTIQLLVGGPDLVLENIRVDGRLYAAPVTLRTRETIQISVNVKNVGSFPTSGPFALAFYNSTSPNQPFHLDSLEALGPSASSDYVSSTWRAPETNGSYFIMIEVDYYDDVQELNEENNKATVTLVVYIEAVEPPKEEEPNYKPTIAFLFALTLAVIGTLVGYKRPLDRYIPPPAWPISKERKLLRMEKLRKMTLREKFQFLTLQEALTKFSKDRIFTMTILAVPLSLIEIIIGILSLLTGALRVPEDGSWISVGMIVNLIFLGSGLYLDQYVSRKGYSVPREEELGEIFARREGATKPLEGEEGGLLQREKIQEDSIGEL